MLRYKDNFHTRASLIVLLCAMCTWVTAAAPIKVVHVNADHGPQFYDYLLERAAAFSAKHPGVEIEVLSQRADYTTKIQLMLASGIQVDVMDSTHSFMMFSERDGLADLMPYVRADGINLSRDMLPFARYVLERDGKLLGVPAQLYAIVTTYNRSYFDEVGVAPLRSIGDDWTWEWLRNNAGRLTRDTNGDGTPDTRGVVQSLNFINLSPAIHQAGGSMFDAYLHPRRALMTTEPVRQGLGFYVELNQRGWLNPLRKEDFFRKRQGAITLYGVGGDVVYFQEGGDVFEAVVQPKGPVRRGGHTFFGPYHIPAESKQQEWAFRWIAYLALDEESQVKMMNATGRIPAHPPTLARLEKHLGAMDDAKRVYLLQVRDASTHTDNYPHTITPAEDAIKRFFEPAWNRVLGGSLALESFLEDMQARMQAELDRLFANR